MSAFAVITRPRVWIAVASAGAILLAVVWDRVVVPDEKQRDSAFDAACVDAAHLHRAGLLDEARRAYVRIAAVEPVPACAGERWSVYADDKASAAAAERGAVYFRAAQLKVRPALQRSREVLFRRSRNAYIQALELDPYAQDARRELAAMIALKGVPKTTAVANARCAFADRLRAARIFDVARMAYAQALRSRLTNACIRYGLRVMREDRAAAAGIVRRAHALDDDGREDEPRSRYIAALAWDPAAPGARDALAATDAPDPRSGTTSGHLRDMLGSAGATVGDAGTAATWAEDNIDGIAVGAVGLLIALPIAMWIIFGLTVTRRGRRIVGFVHLPRFARKHLVVEAFTPADKTVTPRALFVYWLDQPLADPDAAAGETFERSIAGKAVTDLWRAPPPDSASDDIEALFAGSPAQNWVAAALRLAKRVAPSREVHFSGELLGESGHGPGLRVIASRRFHMSVAQTWWAGDLPSAPIEPDAEAEAHHALAIVAATWAHDQFAD